MITPYFPENDDVAEVKNKSVKDICSSFKEKRAQQIKLIKELKSDDYKKEAKHNEYKKSYHHNLFYW